MKFFRIFSMTNPKGCRQFGMPKTTTGETASPHFFFQQSPLPYDELIIPIEAEGRVYQFNFAPLEIPVVTEACWEVIHKICGENQIRSIPGRLSNGELVRVLHVLSIIDCIDYDRSRLTRYPSDYPIQDRANMPQYILELIIDRTKANGFHLFRVKHHVAALVMSGDLISGLQSNGIDGFSIISEV